MLLSKNKCIKIDRVEYKRIRDCKNLKKLKFKFEYFEINI